MSIANIKHVMTGDGFVSKQKGESNVYQEKNLHYIINFSCLR